MVFDNVFAEIALLLLIAAACGAAAVRLRQPLIVAFITVGVVAGPAGFGFVRSRDQLDLLAQMGIALLLFIVGLRLDMHLIRSLGPVALATGLGQVVFTSVIGYFLALALGMEPVTALYVAVALTFSSTIIIVKLLSDKREIDALHGRIAVGFLIVQDIVVVLAMIGLTVVGTSASESSLGLAMLMRLLKAVAFLAGLGLLMRWVFPTLLYHLAQSRELLMLFAIALAVSLASLGDALGFSKEIGAFLAGVALASTPYRETIGARLVSLRDFLLFFFFLDLGAKLDFSLLGAQIGSAAVLSLFVLIGNPLIVMIIMGGMGYRKRTSFLAGLTVAQISEFSLILGALGLGLGHIGAEALGVITLVGVVTIGLSTYLILFSHALYERLAPWLGIFERSTPHRERAQDTWENGARVDAIVFGLGRYGNNIAQGLRQNGWNVLGVDFDPEAVRTWRRQGLLAHYGDAEDPEFPASLPLAQTQWIVSTIPSRDINLTLCHTLRQHGYAGQLALTAHTLNDAERLSAAGAEVVLLPFTDAAVRAVELLSARGAVTASPKALLPSR